MNIDKQTKELANRINELYEQLSEMEDKILETKQILNQIEEHIGEQTWK